MKHIFIVSGEASGDVYGAQLIRSIQADDPDVIVAGLGGDRMAETGMIFLYNLVQEFSVMGFGPVVLGIPKVMRFLEIILDYFDKNRPDILILIDYPGFNMYLATHAKNRGIRTVYYVTPQIWAWAPWRIKKIKRLMDKMLVIFPFEVPLYESAQVPVEYVGHPLVDKVSAFCPDPSFAGRYNITNDSAVLGILPGSRRSIIQRNLPTMLWTAKELIKSKKISHLLLPLSVRKYEELIQKIWEEFPEKDCLPPLTIVQDDTYNVIHSSHLILVTCGTAALETALLQKPMVVMYHVPQFYKWVAQNTTFLQCRFISLPNIISGRKIVPEHLVADKEPNYLLKDASLLWENSEAREKCLHDLKNMQTLLGEPGAPIRAGKAILKMLEC